MFAVGRAVFFGGFATSMVMLSFLFDLVLFFRSGGILALALSMVLLFYAETAGNRSPWHTETWILLKKPDRPQNEHTLRAFGKVMEEVYLFYATYAFVAAVGLLSVSFAFAALGVRSIFNA